MGKLIQKTGAGAPLPPSICNRVKLFLRFGNVRSEFSVRLIPQHIESIVDIPHRSGNRAFCHFHHVVQPNHLGKDLGWQIDDLGHGSPGRNEGSFIGVDQLRDNRSLFFRGGDPR